MNYIKFIKKIILFIGFFSNYRIFQIFCRPLIILYRIVIFDTFILYLIKKQLINHYILQFGRTNNNYPCISLILLKIFKK